MVERLVDELQRRIDYLAVRLDEATEERFNLARGLSGLERDAVETRRRLDRIEPVVDKLDRSTEIAAGIARELRNQGVATWTRRQKFLAASGGLILTVVTVVDFVLQFTR